MPKAIEDKIQSLMFPICIDVLCFGGDGGNLNVLRWQEKLFLCS